MNAEGLRWLREQSARAARSTWPADKNWAAALRMALDEIDRLRPLVLALADEEATVSDEHGRHCVFCGASYPVAGSAPVAGSVPVAGSALDAGSAPVAGSGPLVAHRTGCVKGLVDAYAREQQV